MKVKKLTLSQQVQQLKDEIKVSDYPTFDTGFGTMYLKEKNDYSFHVYHIHTPSETNQIAGKHGTLTEMYYNLRRKEYFIKRNLKDVQFSIRNVDGIFPHNDKKTELFNFISTKGNAGLYEKAFRLLGALGMEQVNMFGRFFHRLITAHNYYELLYKAGITEYTTESYSGRRIIKNPQGNSPLEILGLNKTQWKLHKKYDIPLENVKIGSENSKALDRMMNYLAYVKKLEEEFGLYGKTKSFFSEEKNHIFNISSYYVNGAAYLAERYNLSDKRLIRYIYFETDVSQGLSASSALSDYKDYIRMSTEMGYERFDKYPKFLRTMHDIVARNYQIKLTEEDKIKWKEAIEEASEKFYYAYDGYRILVPTEPSDLVKEGNSLGHCVGSYVNKVTNKTSTILFLRKAEDTEKPLVTIEVMGDKIVQARGKMNNAPKEEEKAFIRRFAKNKELAYRY